MTLTDDLIAQLRARGQRLTIQRRLVLEILCEGGEHLAVQDIQQRLQARGTDLNETTVYRILQWLKDLGIVSQTDLGQSGVVYQILDVPPHHHLVCLNCGHVIDIDDEVMDSLRQQLRDTFDFEPRIDHMAIFGLCLGCQQADDA
jgi:Fur family ferric uptake transcriptional regulator